MSSKTIWFDVGANNGSSSICKAEENPELTVYAFEPVPELVQILKDNTAHLDNYIVIPKAVSDFNGYASFNVRGVDDWGQGSLSDFTDAVDIVWPAGALKFTDKINVDVIRLDTFIEANNILAIDYLHIDAQGNDLKVLRSLGKYVSIVMAGVAEAAKANKTYYVDQNTIADTLKFLDESGFKLTEIVPNDNRDNEFNIYFNRLYK